ncbi:serine/threonine-protein kinase [Streptomyces barkulensis]|uniref:serine/threonine-protein kinase n=1 Tax=Streptomyces barkulensis TaxID=1257026 RepID=UPI000C6CF36A|nr:serine/threonine-protein kinase [Streptomyces barkulensis]
MTGAEHAALRPLQPDDPREVAGYRLTARVGEGGMGAVYLSGTRGNQPVALKVIRREFARDAEFRRRFEQEVRAARRVQGYHIVPVLDHDTGGEQPWLATAYVPGIPLDDALALHGPLPLPAALQLTACTARALQAVHTAGVIHRDLKPSNILLGTDGPWIIDFGIARAADSTQLTRSGGFIGTPQYMSPEHASGDTVTAASDVFSLGLVAAVAATGRHPYGDGAAITLAAQIANTAQRPPDLSGYPEPLRGVLERCLAADPAARPAPEELAELCEKASGRQARDFAGWLPAPLAAGIGERARAAQSPPPPVPPSYAYTPTQGPGGPATGPYAAPTATAYGTPPTAPPHGPGQGPVADPGAGGGRRPRRRTALLAAGAVLVLAASVGGTWAVATAGNEGGGNTGAGKDANAGSGEQAPKNPRTPGEEAPEDTGTPSPEEAGQNSPEASADASAAEGGSFEPVFEKRPITIATPPTLGITYVDLDEARVDPTSEISISDTELIVHSGTFDFRRAMGESAGNTPQECEAAAVSNPLPEELKAREINDEGAPDEGDVLCTVTTEGRLAMLEVTDMVPAEKAYHVPAVKADLTLWKTG